MTYTTDKIASAYASAMGTEKSAATPAQLYSRRAKAMALIAAKKSAKAKPAAGVVRQTFGGLRQVGRFAGTPGGHPAVLNAARTLGRGA